eukprot:2351556-Alexandrium_andersonii.AAC.1
MGIFEEGQVLVTDMTNPDWEPIMKKAGAIVTNSGDLTSHTAIIASAMGIPAIVGASAATEVLAAGDEITVVCSGGDAGRVYKGILKLERWGQDLGETQEVGMSMRGIGSPESVVGPPEAIARESTYARSAVASRLHGSRKRGGGSSSPLGSVRGDGPTGMVREVRRRIRGKSAPPPFLQ